ncbi:MAG: tRNA pseudouridine(54/55) synthase Pus10 [Candidatus Bilamarchaeaceae archaeon]
MPIDRDKLGALVSEAASYLRERKPGTYAISTSVDKKDMVREELEFDKGKRTCLKADLNSEILSELRKHAGPAGYSPNDPEVRFNFDLIHDRLMISHGRALIFGRYFKYSRNLSQSRWLCKACNGSGCPRCNGAGKNYISIEEKMGDVAKKMCDSGNYFLHASGREDIDVENHAGRPFVLELQEAGKRPRAKEIEKAVNSANKGELEVKNLRYVPHYWIELVSDSHFDKAYAAQVKCYGKLTKKELSKLGAMAGATITQRTPVRVAHRRADLERKRKVLELEVSGLSKGGEEFKLVVLAEPGTYIKELISGDEDRTEPSVSSILGKKCVCSQLTVSKIKDSLLDLFC